MSDYKLDICSINETNLESDIVTETLFLPHFAYKLHRCDRINGKGSYVCALKQELGPYRNKITYKSSSIAARM